MLHNLLIQRLSEAETKVMHWLANQTEAVEKFSKTANLTCLLLNFERLFSH